MLRNRRIVFTCATDAVLEIQVHAGKKDWEIKAVTKTPQPDGKLKKATGAKSWFEKGNAAQEKEAEQRIEHLIEQAKKGGWQLQAEGGKGGAEKQGFDSIPAAPAKPVTPPRVVSRK